MYHKWDGGKAAFKTSCHSNRKLLVTYNGKTVSPRYNTFSFDPISIKLAGNEDRYKISDEFEFRPGRTTHLNDIFSVIYVK